MNALGVGHPKVNRTYVHPFLIDFSRGQALQERNRGLEDTQKEVAAALEAKSAAMGSMEEERRALKYVRGFDSIDVVEMCGCWVGRFPRHCWPGWWIGAC